MAKNVKKDSILDSQESESTHPYAGQVSSEGRHRLRDTNSVWGPICLASCNSGVGGE